MHLTPVFSHLHRTGQPRAKVRQALSPKRPSRTNELSVTYRNARGYDLASVRSHPSARAHCVYASAKVHLITISTAALLATSLFFDWCVVMGSEQRRNKPQAEPLQRHHAFDYHQVVDRSSRTDHTRVVKTFEIILGRPVSEAACRPRANVDEDGSVCA